MTGTCNCKNKLKHQFEFWAGNKGTAGCCFTVNLLCDAIGFTARVSQQFKKQNRSYHDHIHFYF